MRHGYTNQTSRSAGEVRKTYAGPDAAARAAAELRALRGLHGRMPVARVVSAGPRQLVTGFVSGEHGQDLLDAGHGAEVLAACGALLRRLHDLDPAILGSGVPSRPGEVIRHGDFGPNNVLLNSATMTVTALLDWEFSGVGARIDDLAWCEWIVRMHHPDAVVSLPAFFEAYGDRPEWVTRQTAMVDRCRWLEGFTRRWEPDGPGVRGWQDRTALTLSWRPR